MESILRALSFAGGVAGTDLGKTRRPVQQGNRVNPVSYDVVIVGSGHGGATAAISLRQNGFGGTIAIISKERGAPYERPPLSKDYLAQKVSFEKILVRPMSYWTDHAIDLVLGCEVRGVDPHAAKVILDDGRALHYRKLIWSAGGTARRLACLGGDLDGLHYIREKADVDRIVSALNAGARDVVIVGGGYIGLEAASVLTSMGCHVTVLEAAERVLSRVSGKQVSQFLQIQHRARGVNLRLSTCVVAIEPGSGQRKVVRLASGEALTCDMVVVGIGITPNVGPLVAAGASASNGVGVDEYCRTSLPHVYAIGDCAGHKNPAAGGRTVRLESVQNATQMAVVAAKDICGNAEPYSDTPWFWSDQFDFKLQSVGLHEDHDVAVLRGDPVEGSFSMVYLKDGKVTALECVNSVKDYIQGRKLVESGSQVPIELLYDTSVALSALLVAVPPDHH